MKVIPKKVILFSQIMGIFPFSYTVDSKMQKTIVLSRIGFAWGVTVLMVQTASLYTGFLMDYISKLEGHPIRMQNNSSLLASLLDLIPQNLVYIVVFFSTCVKHPKFAEMSRLLTRSDAILKHSEYKLNLWIEVLLPIIHINILLSCAFAYESVLCLRTHDHNLYAIFIPGFAITFLVAVAFVIHFSYVTRSIGWRFKMLNEAFKRELNFNDSPADLSSRLRTLADIYWTLCDAVVEANSFYSVQILAVIFLCYAEFIMSSYYLFLEIWPVIEPVVVPHIFVQVTWLVTHIALTVSIVWPSTAVTNAADEIGTSICKLMKKETPREIRNQINLFLRQLPHHCARFSALGFFEIQNHILTSIAGSVTTYLVILIQFYINSKQ